MDGEEVLAFYKEVFARFLSKMGFVPGNSHASGMLYLADYSSASHRVEVMYEPGDNWLELKVFKRLGEAWSEYSDQKNTLTLRELNGRYMNRVSPQERTENDAAFRNIKPQDELGERILRMGKELRLVLGRYMSES